MVLTQCPVHASVVERVSVGGVEDDHLAVGTPELLSREHVAVHGAVANVQLQQQIASPQFGQV